MRYHRQKSEAHIKGSFFSFFFARYIRALPSQDLIHFSSVKLAYPECLHLQDEEWTMGFQGGNFA